jgi:hypothetical protein
VSTDSKWPLGPIIDDDPNFEIIPRSESNRPIQAGRYYRQDQIYTALQSGEAVPVHELEAQASRGTVKVGHDTMHKHISNLNKRLESEDLVVMSTTHYRMYKADEVAHVRRKNRDTSE